MFVDCECCEPDGLGTSHQFADHRRIRELPELAPWVAVHDTGPSGDDA